MGVRLCLPYGTYRQVLAWDSELGGGGQDHKGKAKHDQDQAATGVSDSDKIRRDETMKTLKTL